MTRSRAHSLPSTSPKCDRTLSPFSPTHASDRTLSPQSKFWQHVIRNESDFQRHLDYIHYNPVQARVGILSAWVGVFEFYKVGGNRSVSYRLGLLLWRETTQSARFRGNSGKGW